MDEYHGKFVALFAHIMAAYIIVFSRHAGRELLVYSERNVHIILSWV
jgi:hypothetical protein